MLALCYINLSLASHSDNQGHLKSNLYVCLHSVIALLFCLLFHVHAVSFFHVFNLCCFCPTMMLFSPSCPEANFANTTLKAAFPGKHLLGIYFPMPQPLQFLLLTLSWQFCYLSDSCL